MNSNMLRLQTADFARGAALAVIVVVLGSLQQALSAHGFDFASYNWGAILNTAATAFVGYLSKNFISDGNGAVLGKIGGVR